MWEGGGGFLGYQQGEEFLITSTVLRIESTLEVYLMHAIVQVLVQLCHCNMGESATRT